MMSPGVVAWWWFLCAVGVLNITAWSLSAAALRRRQTRLPSESYPACRLQLALSAVYVFGCAFRSVLPVYDVPRLCLFNTWLSSVIVGRSVATLAELVRESMVGAIAFDVPIKVDVAAGPNWLDVAPILRED